MKRMMFNGLMAAVVAIAGFSLANAQGDGQRGPRPGGGPGFGRGGFGGPGIFRHADLTDEQRQQVRAILEEERGDRQGPPPAAALHRQLEAELLADVPDEQKVDTLRRQLIEAQGEALTRQIAVQRKIAQILTPEQRAAARQRLEQAGERRHPKQ